MIHIYGKYYAKVYDHGYILMKENGKNEKGETKWQDLGYYGTLEATIKGTYNNYVKDKFSKTAIELKDALAVMKETRELFRKVLGDLDNV